MKTFSVLFLATAITFADSLFPYSAIALGLWVLGAVIVMNYQRIRG
jgi:hypothetical protein